MNTQVEESLRSDLAIDLFQFMNAARIPYAIVGDTRHYDRAILSDIDIVVPHDHLSSSIDTLVSFAKSKELGIVQVLKHEQSAWYFVLTKTDSRGGIQFIQPDICSDYFRFGRLFIRASEILDDRVVKSYDRMRFCIPAPSKAFVYYLMKKIDKGALSDRQGDYLSAEWQKDPTGARCQLTMFWPNDAVDLLAQAAMHNDWSAVRIALPALKKQLHQGLPFSFKHWLNEIIRKIRRILNPTGLHVVFLGPDGSGKSTVLAKVEKSVSPVFRRTKTYHLRPYFGKNRNGCAPNLNPHNNTARNVPSSLAKLALWWADFTIGYFIDVFPRLVKSTLVLFDRYYHDLTIDPRRYCYGASIALTKLLQHVIPKPDLFILLDAPAEVIHGRKQEVSYEETVKQVERYRHFVRSVDNGHIVDASLPINLVVEQVNQIILSTLAQKVSDRFDIPNHFPERARPNHAHRTTLFKPL
jgi:thymidylate kinase